MSAVRQQAGRRHRADRPGADLVVSKLRRPPVRPGTVRRSPLIERLEREDPRSVVLMVAPPGYGKATVLSQWAERSGRSFAWVSVDEADDDPKVLLSYVAEALDAVEPIDERVFDALASAGSSVAGSVVPKLASAFASMSVPVVLVLDDVHVPHDRECLAALSVLADHVPSGSRLVLSGRGGPPLRVARLRAEGRILELGAGELSLTAEEASALLRNAGLALAAVEVAALHERTEGWPAGLYLAVLYLREGGQVASAAVSFGGDDRLVSEYVESEFLVRISRRQRLFLTRSAVLDRMCGPLCDVVLEQTGSASVLAVREVHEILRRRPGLGVFARHAEDLRAELSRARGPSALGATALTDAELRLLPMLSTHLSFPEIAAELFLSPNTIKSTVHSVYRKLGTSSRRQAVSRLRDLGLLET